jgi:branched-chain amino acid transport system substrate-binding protein
MMQRRTVRWGLLAVVAALVATAAAMGATSRTHASDIHIGMVAPLTGPYVFVGGPESQAAQKAVNEINAKGGVLGHHIVLDILDDATNPANSVAQTQKIVNDSKYAAILGTGFGSAAFADEPVARGKILYIAMSASAAQVSPPQDGVYVVPPTSRLFAYRLGIYLRKAHLTRIALLHDNGAYPTEGISNVKEFASKFGLQIVSDQTFSLTATDWSAELTKIKNSDAQAVWLWNLPQAVAITKQFKSLGLKQQLVLSGGNATSNYTQPVCPAANGAYADSAVAEVAKYLPKTNKARPLALHVDKLMGEAGNQFYYDGYTGVQLIVQAIQMAKGNTDRQVLMSQFDHFSHWEPEGLYTFNKLKHGGVGLSSVVAETIRNCKLVPLPGQPQFTPPKPKKK